MNHFLDGLARLALKFEVVQPSNNKYAHLIFGVGCAIFSLSAVIADLSLFWLHGNCLLELRPNAPTISLFFLAWSVGAWIIGYLGQVVGIFRDQAGFCMANRFYPDVGKSEPEDDEQEPMEEVDKLKLSALFSGRGDFVCKRAIIELNRRAKNFDPSIEDPAPAMRCSSSALRRNTFSW